MNSTVEKNEKQTFGPALHVRPLLLSDTQAARVLGIGRTLFLQLDSSGRIPQAVRLGKRKLWRTRELESWVDMGMPNRDQWRYESHTNGRI